jgi:diaminopimelate decarboxylase
VNTAGYFMDFNASHSIMHPIAQKVAVWQRGDEFKWALDSQYSPITTNN